MTDRQDLLRRRFVDGVRYATFKAAMRENRDTIEQIERDVALDPDCLERLRALPEPLRALAIAEDWCRDSIDNLPIVARLAETSGKLDLRVFTKEQAPELMALYLKDGKYESLPVFVLFDGEFNEVGRFIERPDSVTELRAQLRRERGDSKLPMSQLPEDQLAANRKLIEDIRIETRAYCTAEVQRELGKIFDNAAQRAGSRR